MNEKIDIKGCENILVGGYEINLLLLWSISPVAGRSWDILGKHDQRDLSFFNSSQAQGKAKANEAHNCPIQAARLLRKQLFTAHPHWLWNGPGAHKKFFWGPSKI
jgi:hypothetical protein